MARFGVCTLVAACALALAGCADAYSGLSAAEGVQTVGDATAFFAHRPTGSQYAAAAIGSFDSLGALMRELSRARSSPAFCRSFSGAVRVSSLAMSFAWEGSARGNSAADAGGSSATASGLMFLAPEGSIRHGAVARANCPNYAPTFTAGLEATALRFRIPIAIEYRGGELQNVRVSRASFGQYTMSVDGIRGAGGVSIVGVLANHRIPIASLQADRFGNGNLTITSTGAQYRLANWMVVA